MEKVVASQKELLSRFPISRRLALRVVALMQSHLFLSPVVLESAVPKNSLEKFLLQKKILQLSQKGKWEELQDFLKTYDEEDLVLYMDEEGERILVFEEEILAQETEKEMDLEAPSSESLLPLPFKGSQDSLQLSRWEQDQLFTPERLSHLKLELFTSSNPEVRRESLRKIAFSSLGKEEKNRIFLAALKDEEPFIRQEALAAMITIDLDADILPLLQKLVGDSAEEGLKSAVQLIQIHPAVNECTEVVILATLLRSLELFEEVENRTAILEFLSTWKPKGPFYGQMVVNLLKQVLQYWDEKNPQIQEKIHLALVNLASLDINQSISFIEKEVSGLEKGALKTILIRTLLDLDFSSQAPRLKDWILTEELEDYLQKKRAIFPFEDILDHFFDEVFDQLIDKIQSLQSKSILQCVQLLEELLLRNKPTKQQWKSFYEAVLKALPLSPLSMVSWALRSKIMGGDKMLMKYREKFAKELLYHIQEGQFAEFRSQILEKIESLGKASLKPLFVFLKDRAIKEHLREEGCQSMARLLLRLDPKGRGNKKAFQDMFRKLLHLYQDDEPIPKGSVAVLLGKIARAPLAEKEQIQAIYQTLLKDLGKSEHTYEKVKALAFLSEAAFIGKEGLEKMARIFLLLLGRSSMGRGAHAKIQMGEIYFEEDLRNRIQSDLMPVLLQGITKIALRLEGHIKYLIHKTLLIKWKKVVSFEEVWSPFNIQHLTQSITQIASHPKTPREIQEEILKEFLSFFESTQDISTALALGEIFFRTPFDMEFRKEGQHFMALILDYIKEASARETTEVALPEIYLTLAKILSRNYGEHQKDLWESGLNVLIKGLREGHEKAEDALLFLYHNRKEPQFKKKIHSILPLKD